MTATSWNERFSADLLARYAIAPEPPSVNVIEPFVELITTIFFSLPARTLSMNASDTASGPRTFTAMIWSNSA